MLFLLFRNGLLPADLQKLLAHSQLPSQDGQVIENLALLGVRTSRPLKDTTPPPQPLFGKLQAPSAAAEEYALSRFVPVLKQMLENHVSGTLDQAIFPFTKPQLDASDGLMGIDNVSQASLRSAKPTWAKSKIASIEPRQRVIVFMAGGATYAESRACYEVSHSSARDVYLITSHMLAPSLFLRQVGDLSADKRRLDIPADRPKPKPPSHIYEREEPPSFAAPNSAAPPRGPAPPVSGLGAMTLNSSGSRPASGPSPQPPVAMTRPMEPQSAGSGGKLKKDKEEKEKDKKKKHHFFSKK
jgi:syntaxin-binding protein 1